MGDQLLLVSFRHDDRAVQPSQRSHPLFPAGLWRHDDIERLLPAYAHHPGGGPPRHGSWNREKKFGYDVATARVSGGKAKIEPFLTGLLNEEKNEFYGRPSYVLQLKDGSLLVSDENNGAVYRISYGDAKTASR